MCSGLVGVWSLSLFSLVDNEVKMFSKRRSFLFFLINRLFIVVILVIYFVVFSLFLTYILLLNMVDFTYCCLKIWGAYTGSPEKQLYRVDVEDIR